MDNGQPLRLVQLANPWGSGEWKGDWADYNIFNKGLASGKWAENPELSKRIGVVRRDEGSFWMSYEETFFCWYLSVVFFPIVDCLIGSSQCLSLTLFILLN
jgi:hypothetical protein